ncbi:polysaccharide deacetylase family protein [Martelella limonii]|uniref:polysaccharide deacetylase family protein n=1 Tax=Martelella limonii TaxID=1647649 RepID=UPI0015809C9A|nr:polysaccharide deacetylase family protein [Martelella limonii]
MTDTEDRYETIALPADLLWPKGRRIAVVFNVAWEIWRDGRTSGVGPMGNVLPGGLFDPNADSYGRYNAASGSRRLLDILERNGVRASILASGLVAERQPEALSRAARAGHDIVGHGLSQDMLSPMLSAEDDRASIERSTAAITAATGARPSGWVSPRVTSGPSAQRRLMRAGYRWHGDALDADRPYLQRFAEGEILAIPMSVEFNDLPHAMRFGRTPGQFVDLFVEALNGIKSQPPETIILDIFAHGHCFGRPAAAWAINDIAAHCFADPSLWLTTRAEIADHCYAAMNARPTQARHHIHP